ncbi:MAG: hypothetical protein A2132_01605 [Nitrospirae bacterium RBG_16_43_11]|nr:MAG: hypothetical protein A2132_01605 [Nitrospirae bacterium RBG_16_43_11]
MKDGKRIQDLETIAALAAISLLLYFIFKRDFLIVMSFALLISGLALKKITSKLSDLWLRFSHIIANINNRIILTFVFYILLTPIAVIYRLFSMNPLMLNKDNNKKSYFVDRDIAFKKEDFEKIW